MKFEFSLLPYFPLLGYTNYGNSRKQRKIISRFSRCALRPALGAFLRDIGGKIAGIPQCRALGTTLLLAYVVCAQTNRLIETVCLSTHNLFFG